ncbi:hypothetical protein BVRB_5g101590 [Beta vulgaris subsp. vulgaris]|nr:hypothetical protein BVRB_5g101590 [Beta vulgaris subsp. vulgaris]
MTLQLGCVPTANSDHFFGYHGERSPSKKSDISFSNRMLVDGVRALGHHENSVVWLPVASQWRNLHKICNSHVFSTSKLDASQSLRRNKVKDLILCGEKQ